MVRIASFNVENLFARPKAFRETNLTIAEPILQAYEEVNTLFQRPVYTPAHKARMRDLLVTLDIYAVNNQGVVRRKDSVFAPVGLSAEEPRRLRPSASGRVAERRDHGDWARTLDRLGRACDYQEVL